VAFLSLLRAGCVAVPLSTRLPAEAVPPLLARVGCRRLTTESVAPAISAAGIEVLEPGMFWKAADQAQSPTAPLSRRGDARDAGGWKEDLPSFASAAPATIVFTSGSTGAPKAALHSFENHWASAAGANRNLPLRPGDRWLLSLPLWHVGGLAVIFRCLQGGAAAVIAGEGEPLADAVLSLGVTHLSLVATQLRRLLGDPRGREALRSLKAVLLGGGPLPAPLIEAAAALGARIVATYGSTETASQAAATRCGDPPEALRTAGRALPFREIAVDAGGEILARGRTLFLGYLDGGNLSRAHDERGWFHTGDLGRIDEAGRLLVEGRRDNMFIAGGENIHPEEIERALADFPGVLDALVVPVPDAEFGARPAAFLRTLSGELPDPVEIGAFLRRSLPGFKVPVRYLPWPRLEEGMKPDRWAFAELARDEEAAGRR
jgi:O-succinylbenzoic acid--CoA ligase